MSRRSFGRRPNPLAQPAHPQLDTPPNFQRKIAAFEDDVVEPRRPVLEDRTPSVDEELQHWKKSRKGFVVPWRQLSLMASLSFGIASFVLPASVNQDVHYVLYALAGMSLYAGISKRLKI